MTRRIDTRARLLTAAEIVGVDASYLEFSTLLEERREHDYLARKLHRIKLPTQLSESLAALVLRAEGADVSPGGREADLIARRAGTRRRRVEVKGTGRTCWTMLTTPDTRAHDLVWIDYARRLADGTSGVDARVIALTGGVRPDAGRALLTAIVAQQPPAAIRGYRIELPSLTVSPLSRVEATHMA